MAKDERSSRVASAWRREAHVRELEGLLSLRPDYGFSEAALPRGSAERVASRWASSAESYFWNNPQKYEVRQFAETKAISNVVPVAEDSTEDDKMGISRGQEKAKAKKAPPTPSEIVKTVPGSENFSTLSRFLLRTEQPTPSVPTGKVDRPMHPDPEEHESAMADLNPPPNGKRKAQRITPLQELILDLQETLPAHSVKLVGDKIKVTGSDRDEVMGAIQGATQKLRKTFPSMPVSFSVGHKPGGIGHTVFLSVRFD